MKPMTMVTDIDDGAIRFRHTDSVALRTAHLSGSAPVALHSPHERIMEQICWVPVKLQARMFVLRGGGGRGVVYGCLRMRVPPFRLLHSCAAAWAHG